MEGWQKKKKELVEGFSHDMILRIFQSAFMRLSQKRKDERPKVFFKKVHEILIIQINSFFTELYIFGMYYKYTF